MQPNRFYSVGHTQTPRPLELLETFAAGGAEPGCQSAGFPVPFVYCQNRTDLTSARTRRSPTILASSCQPPLPGPRRRRGTALGRAAEPRPNSAKDSDEGRKTTAASATR